MQPRIAVFLLAAGGAAFANVPFGHNGPFDPRDALSKLGVDPSLIPETTGVFPGSSNGHCRVACKALARIFGTDRVMAPNTTAYIDVTSAYWSAQQGEVQPSCIFAPAVDKDVSALVLISQLTDCPFAAKSGGHAAFAGASSIDGGITVLFRDLNEVTLNQDKSIASIGPGNTWGDVYTALEPHGLAVVGGRVANVGVGGLTTGGGISYHSNLYGWALDNVQSFEIVTATGAILTASEIQHPDLYWALRGGGNNFGLVTRFNLYTIPSPPLYGSTRVYTEDMFPAVVDAFINVANNASHDGNAQQYVAFGRLQGINIASAELTYIGNVSEPAIFRQYRSITAAMDTSSSRTLPQYCAYVQTSNPNGLREVYWNHSFNLNKDFSSWVIQYFFSILHKVEDIPGILPVLVFQAITQPQIKAMSRFGGNALGFDQVSAEADPIHLPLIACMWQDAADDESVYRFISDFYTVVVAKAKTMGVQNSFVYMNYASQFQDVISSYGPHSKARLQQIASAYDPAQVFQKLQPGYFKLNRAPFPGLDDVRP
ncbi:FAD binding domain protein, partial [Aspergillus granulosus]